MAKQRKTSTTHARQGRISRRKFLQTGVVASAAVGMGLPAAVALGTDVVATSAPATATTGLKVLTVEQSGVLTTILNGLVPAEGQMTAAGDLGIATFIDGLLADAPHLRRPILDVITEVKSASADGRVEGEALDRLLAKIEHEQKASFDTLLQATYTAYYSHPEVLQALGVTAPHDHGAETFDVALLEDVIKRGPMYRQQDV